MATYKEIRGTQIEAVSSDPSNPIDGQVWYNTTDNVLKGNRSYSVAWATGGTLNTARYVLAGAGTQTLGLAFGGETPPHTANTEKYNGSNWTEVNNLNTSRQELSGGGTQTSALAFGGRKPAIANETESWNGTNWTEVNNLNTSRRYMGGVGADNTACLCYGGPNAAPGGSQQALTEQWNGTNWTEVNDLNTARGNNDGGAGTYTAALWAGGDSPPASPINVALTESWNGTNWTEVNDLNQGRQSAAMIGATNTASICFGGVDPSSGPVPSIMVLNELWNGTNWTETTDLSTGRHQLSGAGSSSSGLAFGGRTPTVVGNTEEWNDGPVVSTFTDS
tara:strand:- start:45 stop:1049 length:1005 start_codon:yes stop_codon:yes gene_type:complete